MTIFIMPLENLDSQTVMNFILFSKVEELCAKETMLAHKHTLNGREEESVMGG